MPWGPFFRSQHNSQASPTKQLLPWLKAPAHSGCCELPRQSRNTSGRVESGCANNFPRPAGYRRAKKTRSRSAKQLSETQAGEQNQESKETRPPAARPQSTCSFYVARTEDALTAHKEPNKAQGQPKNWTGSVPIWGKACATEISTAAVGCFV